MQEKKAETVRLGNTKSLKKTSSKKSLKNIKKVASGYIQNGG